MERMPITQRNIQDCRKRGKSHLKRYLIDRTDEMRTLPEGWLTPEEVFHINKAASERSQITEDKIVTARRDGVLVNFLSRRISQLESVPIGLLSPDEIAAAKYKAQQEALPLIDRDGRFGRSKSGNPTFTIDNYVLWWGGVSRQGNCTGREFLAWTDSMQIKVHGREHLEPPQSRPVFSSHLERVAALPMDQLRFSDFMALHVESGRDPLSNQRLSRLMEQVSAADAEAIELEFANQPKAQAGCLRWRLRGLPLEKAVRKVHIDAQVGGCAAQAAFKNKGDHFENR